jgi:hypothetical protein
VWYILISTGSVVIEDFQGVGVMATLWDAGTTPQMLFEAWLAAVGSDAQPHARRDPVLMLVFGVLGRATTMLVSVSVYCVGYLHTVHGHVHTWLMFFVPSLAMNVYEVNATARSARKQIRELQHKLELCSTATATAPLKGGAATDSHTHSPKLPAAENVSFTLLA